MVSPAVFIAIAEETGFIVALGQWVLEEGLRQSAAWHAAGMPTKIAVNVSAIQFQQANFVSSGAEGVETIEQASILRAMGCQEGQGFLWSPAVAPDALEKQVYYLNDT